jgi:hypothetical protein
VYTSSIKEIVFISNDVLKKPLNGLITNRKMIKIEVAEHIHIFLVSLVNIVKLNGVSESI